MVQLIPHGWIQSRAERGAFILLSKMDVTGEAMYMFAIFECIYNNKYMVTFSALDDQCQIWRVFYI